MSRLKKSLDDMASRGTPRGAIDVYAAAAEGSAPRLDPEPPRRNRSVLAFAGGFAAVLAVGVLLGTLLGGGGRDPQAVPPDTTNSPTTTLFESPGTLPPASDTPGPTVPAGAELEWYEFVPSLLQLAWRATEGGTELCWRNTTGQDCVDNAFVAPEVVVIPSEYSQVVVLTRAGTDGAPERVVLELSDGSTTEVTLIASHNSDLLWGFSESIDASVVSAAAGEWPEIACATPPESALDVSGSAFEMKVPPGRVRPGEVIDLFVGAPSDFPDDTVTGVPTNWQCWDGSEWVTTHVMGKAMSDAEYEPETYRVEAEIGWVALGLGVPDTFQVRVPDVAPGIYRIQDNVYPHEGYVIVEVSQP